MSVSCHLNGLVVSDCAVFRSIKSFTFVPVAVGIVRHFPLGTFSVVFVLDVNPVSEATSS